ncbi:hypothetical protein [Deinococcus sp.]|uniref:hypothetical protein n=1 Tax=Deinococcus sp. TaxID=47478 RepID=UPI0025F82BA3|nr:hypothetical protein [Deinococcus sp.]
MSLTEKLLLRLLTTAAQPPPDDPPPLLMTLPPPPSPLSQAVQAVRTLLPGRPTPQERLDLQALLDEIGAALDRPTLNKLTPDRSTLLPPEPSAEVREAPILPAQAPVPRLPVRLPAQWRVLSPLEPVPTPSPSSRASPLRAIRRSARHKRDACLDLAGGGAGTDAPAHYADLPGPTLRLLAELFEGVALSALLLARPQVSQGHLQLAATAQSALAAQVERLNLPADADQVELFRFLKHVAFQRQHYLSQHMTLADRADPAQIGAVLEQLQAALAPPGTRSPSLAALSFYPPAVEALSAHLSGRTILMIGGGVDNPAHVQRCQDAGLSVRWRNYKHGESHWKLASEIRQPDVAVVVVAVRWSSHDSVLLRPLCAEYGKAFVMLKAGYGVNTLASEVAAQLGLQVA